MKQTKLTPGRNLMWESSRMMLPEHREQFLEHRKQLGTKTAPELDDQERDRLDQLLAMAARDHQTVRLTLFDPFDNLTYKGTIQSLDAMKKRLKFKHEDGLMEPIFIEMIIDAEVN